MARGEMIVLADPAYETSSWFARCFAGLRAEAARCDFLVTKADSPAKAREGGARACVLFGADAPWVRETTAALHALGVRSVLAGAQPDAFYGASGAVVDRRMLMEDTVRYFIANGRRRLACLGGEPTNINDAIRIAAFHSAMRACGLSSGEGDVFTAEKGIDACALALLENARRYDGALCVNDQTAVRLIALAREKSVRVPEDLFVSGSGNLLVGRLCHPTLTTSDLDYYQMGRKTVGVWQHLERTPDVTAMTVTIPHRLIPRGSTAFLPPADGAAFPTGASAPQSAARDAAPLPLRRARSAHPRGHRARPQHGGDRGGAVRGAGHGQLSREKALPRDGRAVPAGAGRSPRPPAGRSGRARRDGERNGRGQMNTLSACQKVLGRV